ncbi:MAG: sigma 54-interacting transcriptional regulator [Deltaproteobacteria bacterium]|nr:sigma 54-interacting transcriptional regulator [Deltaproteobacteria bacterium]
MSVDSEYKPEFDSFKDILLEMAQERSGDALLRMIVERLAQRPHVALVRIWLIQPGDLCSTCTKKSACPDRTFCLHLVASKSAPLNGEDTGEAQPDRGSIRLPLGNIPMGPLTPRDEPRKIIDILRDSEWMLPSPWAREEKIQGYGLQPLLCKGEMLGVLAIYSRIPMDMVSEGAVWLRMVANHAAIAIANVRAFEEIENLKKQLELENTYLREELDEVSAFGDIIGKSPALMNVLEQIALVAPTGASVLILGESGTGKELVAREIHKRSERSERPMIKVNCANIPRDLYESEFFGHVKGAFTGAVRDRPGRFEAAHGGTLFLDEVGEIPLDLQGKLLRVLQEGRYERVGEEATRQVDVRIIAATNRDLKQEVEVGRFRHDLYYRLNVFPIEVAPLRQRKDDIPLLAAHFLSLVSGKMKRPVPKLAPSHIVELKAYHWPGNVRELQNVMERAVITRRSGRVRFDLPQGETPGDPRHPFPDDLRDGKAVIPESEMRERERENVVAALNQCGWKIYGPSGAAELLGIKPTTLTSRIKKLGLKRPAKPAWR